MLPSGPIAGWPYQPGIVNTELPSSRKARRWLFAAKIELLAAAVLAEKDFGIINNPSIVSFGGLPAQRARRCE